MRDTPFRPEIILIAAVSPSESWLKCCFFAEEAIIITTEYFFLSFAVLLSHMVCLSVLILAK